MKTIKISTLLAALSLFLFASCVKDDDFALPDVNTKILEFDGKVISVSDAIAKSSASVETYADNEAIEGYVISSDEGGNFYKDIYIQALDGSDGFIVSINKSGLYGEYPLGTKVQVRLQGLSTAIVNNKLEIGYGVYKTSSVGQMPVSVFPTHLINLQESVEFSSLAKTSSTLDNLAKDENLNMLLRFENIAFDSGVMGQTYHIAANDKIYGTNYNLLDSLGNTLPFRTSLYAKHKDEKVPSELVNITGVLTKYRDDYQFLISNIEDVEIIDGTDGSTIKTSNFKAKTVTTLDEKFDSVEKYKDITLEGWYSKAVKGDRNWQGNEFDNDKYLSVTAYSKTNPIAEMEAWIVTPGLDLDKATNKNFTFDSQRDHSKNETFEVLISTDFDPTKGLESATWKSLQGVTLAPASDKYSGFVNAGDIDLSAYTGVVYIAFKYVGGADNNATGGYQIDNVKFNYTPTSTGGDDPSGTSKTVTELNETFDGVMPPKDIALDGWIVENTKGTNTKWIGKEYNSNYYAQISGFKSSDTDIVAWLVTPGLDLDNATNKNFSFETKRGYSKAENFEVLISTDFDASKSVSDATWTTLPATLADANASGYGSLVSSGDIDLSSHSGVVYIAFKYTGNNSDATGTYQLDNVKFNYTAGSDPSSGGDTTSDTTTGGDTTSDTTTGGDTTSDTTTGGDTTSDTTTTTDNALFPGSDFEDWSAFESSLNSYGLLTDYASKSSDGKDSSNALHVSGEPTKNKYLFTTLVPENFTIAGKTKISFYIKGTSPNKSLSINLYKEDGSYYPFNLGDCSADANLTAASSNSYSGAIDTNGDWVKVTLDIAGLTDIATTAGSKLFAIKIGKKSAYDLLIDEITFE